MIKEHGLGYALTLFIIVIILALVACSVKDKPPKADDPPSLAIGTVKGMESEIVLEPIDPIQEILDQMTLNEKIGQLLIFGLEAYELDEETRTMIDQYKLAGIILFQRNIEDSNQLLTLVNQLKEANSNYKIPLFISIDEEGGRVSRLPDEIEALPSHQDVGNSDSEANAWQLGTLLGAKVKAFGINMNFAPVLDINSNPENTVIGDRAFGSDADLVSRLGVQSMKAMQGEGIIPVVKHFPGHGDTLKDSHIELPMVSYGLERLQSVELKPFKAAIASGADAVMVAHLLVTEIDAENPASLSKSVITNLLRESLGFSGVVISDDLTMGAIVNSQSIGEATIQFLLAGGDLALICHGVDNQKEVIEALQLAVKSGRLSERRLDESVYRILSLKKAYDLCDASIEAVDIDMINSQIKAFAKTLEYSK